MSLAAAVVSNVVSTILAPVPTAGGTGATAPIPSIAITSPSSGTSGTAAGTTGTATTGTGTTSGSAADSFLVALDSASPPMGQPLVLFLLPSPGSVSLTGAGCPSTTGCLAPSAGLYGYNGVGSVSGTSDVYAQLGLSGGGAYGVTVPSLAGASGVSSYLVQAFQVPVNLDPAAPIALSEVGAPAGTVVAAYDCVASACANGIAASPLATVGVITSGGGVASAAPATPLGASTPTPQVASALAPQVAPVDEPAVSAVWGIALLGMIFVRRLQFSLRSRGC